MAEQSKQPNRRMAQGEISRNKLLQAATRSFAERGYSATSIDDVCREAQVVKSAVYWHFESKEGLLAAVLEEAATSWIRERVDAARQIGAPQDRLSAAFAAVREMMVERPTVLRLLNAMALERAGSDGRIRAMLVRLSDQARAVWVDGIAAAIGRQPRGLQDAVSLVLAALDGIFLQFLLRGDAAELDRLFARLERMFLVMILQLETESDEPRPVQS